MPARRLPAQRQSDRDERGTRRHAQPGHDPVERLAFEQPWRRVSVRPGAQRRGHHWQDRRGAVAGAACAAARNGHANLDGSRVGCGTALPAHGTQPSRRTTCGSHQGHMQKVISLFNNYGSRRGRTGTAVPPDFDKSEPVPAVVNFCLRFRRYTARKADQHRKGGSMFGFKSCRNELAAKADTHCVVGRAVSVGPTGGRPTTRPLHPVIAALRDWNQLICGPLWSFVVLCVHLCFRLLCIKWHRLRYTK